jgi:hypothetical protein
LGVAGARAGDWPTGVLVRRHAQDRLPLLHIPAPCAWACSLARVLRPWAWLAGLGREARGRKEGYLCLAPIPTFRSGMIRDGGQGQRQGGISRGW